MIKTLIYILFVGFISPIVLAEEVSEAQELLNATQMHHKKTNSSHRSDVGFDSCLLTPNIEIDVASSVVGVIKKVLVKRGDIVKKNQVLVELQSDVEKATLKLNKAQTDYGKRTIARNIDLYNRKLISEQEKDDIIMNNRIYSYEMAQTQALIRQKVIKSPVNGIVVDTFLDQGEYVGEEPILKIVNLDPLYVEVVLSSASFGKIKKGDKAEVILESPLNTSHQATVLITDPVLDAASGTFGVRLELKNTDYKLPAGLKCKVKFK